MAEPVTVYSQTLSETGSGELQILQNPGRGDYVLTVSLTSGSNVTIAVVDQHDGRNQTVVSTTVASSPGSNSASGKAQPWPQLKLTWSGTFAGTVTLVWP